MKSKKIEWKIIRKADLILIAALAMVAVVILAVSAVTTKINKPELEILIDDVVYGTYSLEEDQIIKVTVTNVVQIKDGKVTMIDATCPDHLCMEFRPIDKNGGSIICLPNHVILHIINAEESENSVDNNY